MATPCSGRASGGRPASSTPPSARSRTLGHDVTRRGAYQAYLGSGEHSVRVRMLGGDGRRRPGDEGLVRIHLPVAVPLLPGDRYILRESGRDETVGGGRCSTWRRRYRPPGPDRPGRSTGWSPSGVGSPPTTSSG